MEAVYLVAWYGGYDPPSFAAFLTLDDAWVQAERWEKDMVEGEDAMDVLRIDLRNFMVERMPRPSPEGP